MDIYEPAEDSYLLQKVVQQYASGRVLDMGTGSGIQALTAIKIPDVREVIAVDSNPQAVQELQAKITQQKLRKIKTLQSTLFDNIHGHFSTIIFNPPYLPQDKGIDDPALYGGKHGWEISERFFQQASRFLFKDGLVLFLFSSLTNKNKINTILQHNLLEYQQVASQKLAFEELYVYVITKSPLLRELEAKNIENIHYFAEGKRGIIYTGITDRNKLIKTHLALSKDTQKMAIKVQKAASRTEENHLENEAYWLQQLNTYNIGPRLLFSGKGYLVYNFVEGEYFLDWVTQNTSETIRAVLRNLLQQCRILDTLGVNKEEMHHPHKHIIVDSRNQPVLLDFERCYKTSKPQNVTQCVEYFCRINAELKKKKISCLVTSLRKLAKQYKDTYTDASFKEIVKIF